MTATDEEIRAVECSLVGGIFKDTAKLIEDLAVKNQVACFSNTHVIHWDYVTMKQPIMQKFHRRIASQEIQASKPSPISYQKLCEALAAKPSRCIFFDDLAENIEAAKNFGIEGYLFTDATAARKILVQKGIL